MKVTWNKPELCVEMEKDEIVGNLKTKITGFNENISKVIRNEDYRYKNSNMDYEKEDKIILDSNEKGYVPH